MDKTINFIKEHTSQTRTLWACFVAGLLIYSDISWYIIGFVWICVELPLVIKQISENRKIRQMKNEGLM